jgi:hypothetical protein
MLLNIGDNQCLIATWPSMSGQCLSAMWPSLCGQCLNAMWPSLDGQFLNATWHLISQIYVWLINLSLTSHLNDHCTKPPITINEYTYCPNTFKKPKKTWMKPPNCLFDGSLMPLMTNHYLKPPRVIMVPPKNEWFAQSFNYMFSSSIYCPKAHLLWGKWH